MKNEVFHIIKDPVHGSMQFTTVEDNWIKPFISSVNFQRQRHIKQLGLTDWIFPGAVHTRFNHGLGCCYIASQIAAKLGLSVANKQIVVLAGLLHDIGHGPFSHTFEEIFVQQAIQHESWTAMFLNEYKHPQFLENFNAVNRGAMLDEDKIEAVQKLITHKENTNKLLADIVSSQLDADRLDYLLRDSHFCGVMYGAYDFSWLLHCLTVIEHNGVQRLGITHKGVGVVEQYLMARRLMIRNVYQNGKKHGAEFLLQEFLKNLARDIAQEKAFLKFIPDNSLIQFLRNVNNFNQQITQTQNFAKLKQDFLCTNYFLYKQLCDYDVLAIIRDLANLETDYSTIMLARRLQDRLIPKILYIHEDRIEKAQQLVQDFKISNRKNILDWQIAVLKLPHLSYEISKDPILVKDFTGRAKFLHDNSQMINAISDKYESAYLISIDAAITNETKVQRLIKELMKEDA
jgi:HD superfamily phosphohydrolase